ncbi:hypothetical protein [Thioclava sp. F36-7]|uniref:hypothetical protein n=1 Tax=Thioclava sp. F36-7 TaxID=1915317 RepID=UPI0009988665|nr:hypothetical protein [Thioclava sp. F36-7]OOY07362.1 hypothetical protein BMI89_17980 [Thioclava sp. F36-7]
MIYKLSTPITVEHEGGTTRTIRALDLHMGHDEAATLKYLFNSEMPDLARAMASIDVCAGLPATTAMALDVEDIDAAFTQVSRLVEAYAEKYGEAAQ